MAKRMTWEERSARRDARWWGGMAARAIRSVGVDGAPVMLHDQAFWSGIADRSVALAVSNARIAWRHALEAQRVADNPEEREGSSN